jgi:regulator of sirC expression with transglutaminase-like and TPR domain
MESLKGESLIKLLDDPDQMVFEAVTQRIKQLGAEILPDLESAAKKAMTPILHDRIEQIIKMLHFDQLKSDLGSWILSPYPKLLDGAWMMSRYQFPDLTRDQFIKLIKPLKDEIWLEISENLTGLEKIRIMNAFFFGRNRVTLNEVHPDSPGNNYINRVMETHLANEHSISLLYALIGQELGMPIFAADMPGYPILTYIDMPMVPGEIIRPELFDVLFYVNPADNGSVHSRMDITNYLIRQSLPLEQIFYLPGTNPDFIRICLKKLALDYELAGSEKRSSQVLELISLWK